MKKLLIALTLIVSLFSVVYAGTATLQWTVPTTYVDGSALPSTEILKFTVYQGTASHVYPTRIDVGNVTSYTLSSLGTGTHFFAVSVTTKNGLESDLSNEGAKYIAPTKPSGCTLTVL